MKMNVIKLLFTLTIFAMMSGCAGGPYGQNNNQPAYAPIASNPQPYYSSNPYNGQPTYQRGMTPNAPDYVNMGNEAQNGAAAANYNALHQGR